MRVLLWHLDGKLPNLALMRLAGYHRERGDAVELRKVSDPDELHPRAFAEVEPRFGDPRWDRVYASAIFERTRPLAERVAALYPGAQLGGTGWDFRGGIQLRRTDLPADVAAAAPDYSVYPSFKYSLGFAQRGCRFKCPFCVVPRKEGKVVSASGLEAIWRGGDHPPKVILLDNDFFGNPLWREVIADALRLGIAIAVIQGINARTLNDEQAAAIASVRWMADDFSRRRVYTAWDDEDDERTFFRGLDCLKAHGISPDSVLVYMLIGHAAGETHADRDRRRAKLRAYGARPYPMPFVRTGALGDELRMFQGWCIQRADLHVPWERWVAAKGDPRRLGDRATLSLFDGNHNGNTTTSAPDSSSENATIRNRKMIAQHDE